MGELATLAKARQELEDLYVGVPDESVNLSFQHLAELKQAHYEVGEKMMKHSMDPIKENGLTQSQSMGKSPSLDFSKAIQASRPRQHHVVDEEKRPHVSPRGGHHVHDDRGATTPRSNNNHTHIGGFRNNIDNSVTFDDISGMSVISRSTYQDRGGRRRAGIPHSNICTICTTYIYIFRHRCLVCGRVYCRQCVGLGMGDMTEGRKCVECLDRKFSQRYIHRAGNLGCCGTGYFARYPSLVKQQELKWAEKGPRRSRGERGYDRSGMVSRSRSPVTPRTPTRTHVSSGPNSFAMSSQFSPYTPTHPHLPY
ncbi:hypothetical protein ACHQM5_020649 [Ranunculus cassubicifolius]